MMKKALKRTIKKLPYLRQVFRERDLLRDELARARGAAETLAGEKSSLEADVSTLRADVSTLRAERDHFESELARAGTWVPPGHFYSPFPSREEVARREDDIWRKPLPAREIPGVDLREEAQLGLLREFAGYYRELPFTPHRQERLRYFFENENYSYSDGIVLYCMLRHLRPRRLVEVGSGYSSCVTLDTNELFLGNEMSCTFIEPHPGLLLSLIKEEDAGRIELIPGQVQDVDMKVFEGLAAGDVLFVDSTHVAKALSDVNHLFFEVLPRLRGGVFIHFHDIFYPFVYPKDWELEGRAWNEAYVLRAFLQYNAAFEVYFYNTFLEYFHEPEFLRHMPLCMKSTGGSIWVRKI